MVSSMPMARGHVLIIDDDVSIREIMASALVQEGYAVATVANGLVALAWLKSYPRPDVILLDLWMPVMPGEEFKRALLADPATASIPVIVITAAADGAKRAAAMCAEGFLAKPVRLEAVMEAIDRHC